MRSRQNPDHHIPDQPRAVSSTLQIDSNPWLKTDQMASTTAAVRLERTGLPVPEPENALYAPNQRSADGQ
jgi:hypothetical protein